MGNCGYNPTYKDYFTPIYNLVFGAHLVYMDVGPKIGGKPPKMDGENFMENPMNKWMEFGGTITPIFLVLPTHLKQITNLNHLRVTLGFWE